MRAFTQVGYLRLTLASLVLQCVDTLVVIFGANIWGCVALALLLANIDYGVGLC